MTNKPELISFSEFLMLAPFFDQRTFFAPEIENLKGGIDRLNASGLLILQDEENESLIEYRDNVALLKLNGPFRPGRGWYFSTGYGDIQDAIVELIDADVDTVIQLVDSPGGTVKGAFETEEMFRELAKEKNLISLVIGSATSAAALMTFPANKRYLAGKTAQTGSIGVVAEHIDNRSWYREFLGEVRTSIAKGDMKDAGTDVRGFDEKAKTVFTEAVTKLYDIFADSAAFGLGLTREKIDAMQSRVYIGSDGIAQGFADGFATLNQLLERSKNTEVFSTPGRPAFQNIQTEDNSMDKNKYKAEHPDEYQAILEEGKRLGLEASNETAKQEGEALGIQKERARITGIEELMFPTDFEKKAKSEGMQPDQASLAYQKAEAVKKKEIAATLESDVSQPLACDAPELPSEPQGKDEPKTPEQEFSANADLQAEFGGDFDRYKAFLKAESQGRAKILNKGGK